MNKLAVNPRLVTEGSEGSEIMCKSSEVFDRKRDNKIIERAGFKCHRMVVRNMFYEKKFCKMGKMCDHSS